MPLAVPKILQSLLGSPVAVFGGGVSGRAVANLLGMIGARPEIYDRKSEAGQHDSFSSKEAAAHSLVVFSPGFRNEHPWLTTAAAAGCTCLCELDFASLFWAGRIVAITGTNGKTTLTEFITHALRHAGQQAYGTGNIGYSFSSLIAETKGGSSGVTAVCEVSSFQAEAMSHFKADAIIWSNFAEDHLERHSGMASYFSAKNQLLLLSPDAVVVAGSSVGRYADRLNFTLPADSLVESEGQEADSRLEGTVFAEYPQRENFILALAYWRKTGLAEADLYSAARNFKLGRHRLARVAEIAGVGYWNDSKATNFHAVEAALSRFDSPVILIAGGKAKGGDHRAFVRRIAPRVKHAILIGDTKEALAEGCRENRVPHSLYLTLDEAVAKASALASSGDNVLLSPGFASFDMFSGYDHRGEVFETLVKHLAAAVAAQGKSFQHQSFAINTPRP
ncbi:MAG: UDP-N-acetylmuramoyl-L-alanine--D-glutamate ligase [Opitutaceae bacterium]|jgi:UDP-N-acetylmuramoylalanine--D-glutamate ligase